MSLPHCNRLLALFVGLFICNAIFADTVVIADGSTLKGTVKRVADGKLTLVTEFAGTLTIEMEKVQRVWTDETLHIALESGNTLVGKLTERDGTLVVETVNGPMTIANDKITSVWGKGDPSPAVEAVRATMRKWRYEANFDLSGRTGNTDRVSMAGGGKAVLEGPDDRFMLYLRKQYAETEGEKTVDETVAGMDFERRFAKRHSWYTRGEIERDDIELLNLRTTVAAGYGYYFIDEDDHRLRGRLGGFYRHQAWQEQEDDSTYGLDVNVLHMYEFGTRARLNNEITWTPSIEETGEFRLYHESSLEFPLTSERMKMAIGVSNEYNSEVSGDTKELDTYYFVRLILTWK